MPVLIQWLTNLIPARHFLVIVRGIFLKGSGLSLLWQPALVLLAYGLVLLGCSVAVPKASVSQLGGAAPLRRGALRAGTVMNWRRVLRIVKKEFLQLRRDPRLLRIVLAAPVFQLLIFGYAVTTDVKHIRTAVYDADRTAASRQLADRFVRSGYFDLESLSGAAAERDRPLARRGTGADGDARSRVASPGT